jgi:hypothetical protein
MAFDERRARGRAVTVTERLAAHDLLHSTAARPGDEV